MRAFFLVAVLSILSRCSQSPIQQDIEWKSIEKDLQTMLIMANDGDTIELPAGHFMFTRTLTMDGKSDITIRGKGMNETILSWKNQVEGAQGIQITNGQHILLEDFSVEDAKGDNVKVSDVNGITMRRVRSVWADGPKTENGAYALYPVLCKNVLMEECIAMGSSDAGIYVGQSDSVIIRNNKAYWNVAGIESENSKWVEIYGNEAFENTGGILVFDLPGLTQYGHSTKVYKNKVRSNNFRNFAMKGNIVASIPPGSGMMVLATHGIEIFDNEFIDNTTVGIAIVSYELVAALNAGEQEQEASIGGVQSVDNRFREDSLYNAFPYDVAIHHNQFTNTHWFPSLSNDIGKLLLMESMFSPPDILYDGIDNPNQPERNICIGENGDITFINLDAAREFENLSKDQAPFQCQADQVISLR